MDLNNLKRDATKIEAGEWVTDIPQAGDLKLRVRGMSSKLYTTHISRLGRAIPPEGRQRDNSLKPESARKIMVVALIESVILDWDNLTVGGEKVPFSKEKATEFLNDDNYGPLLDAVIWAASVVDNGRNAVESALAKN